MTSSARWFLLLVLALLLGALSPFAAAPAEAQTTVWSATLTPHNLGSWFGCLNSGATGSPWYCSVPSTLSDDDFTHDSTPYTFTGIYTDDGNIILRIATELPAAFVANASLVVGSTSYALSGATKGSVGSHTTYELDPTPEVNWTAGNQVSLGLSLTQTTTQSTDATLSTLTASSATSETGTYSTLGIGTFAPGTTNYTATVANSVTHVKLTPTVNDSGASVKVGKQGTTLADVTSGSASTAIALAVGANAIDVEVTAEDTSTTQTYTVTVTRQAAGQQTQAVPQSVQVVPGNNKLTLTWQAPSSWAGTQFRDFDVQWKLSSAAATAWSAMLDSSSSTASFTATVTSFEFVGYQEDANGSPHTVTNGTAYDLRVRANSLAGSFQRSSWVTVSNKVPRAPPPSVSLSAPSTVAEGNSVSVTATLSRALSSAVTIPVTLTDNSAESTDHGTLSSITITAGQTTGTGTITTAQDTDEEDETFTVALDTANLPSSVTAGSPSSVQIRIADDEGVPEVTLHVSRNPVKEGRWTLVEVRLKKGGVAFRPPSRVHIPVIVRRGTLESGDLQSLLRHSTQQTATFTIGIGGDYLGTYGRYILNTVRDMDTDDETFTVKLDTASLPPSVQAGSPSSVEVTIKDDGILRAPRNPRDPDTDEPPTDSTPTIQPPPTDTDTPTDDMQSADATLSALEIEEASLDFDPDTYTYTLNAYGEETVTLTPTANHEDAEITVNADRVESGSSAIVPLDDDGVTSIEIVVTAEDGTTRTYTLAVMSCPGEERKILEMFYDRTQGDMGWIESGGWNTQDDLHDWHGVRTENGMVAVLNLPDNDLSGDIPSALLCFGGLEKLSELALWDNDDLSGEVPDGLALPVERAVLRAVAGALELNTEWFKDYGEPFNFKGWHEGVTMDEDGRVTELDFSDTEEIEGTIPAVLLEQLKRLETLYLNCTISVGGDVPAGVDVEEVCEEPEVPESSGGGGCALSTGSGDSPVFGLFLMALLVFAALGRKRAR